MGKLSLLNDFGTMHTFETNLNTEIEGTSLYIIKNKLFVLGGYQTQSGYQTKCNYFELTNDRKSLSKAVSIADLNSSAAYAACIGLDEHRIAYVGGASGHSETMEIYDMIQNKWMTHPAQTKYDTHIIARYGRIQILERMCCI